jgi:hypothetical protein
MKLPSFLRRTKPTSKPILAFSQESMPWAHTANYCIVSMDMGEVKVYGVFNTFTGHIELVFSQLSAAVINMQTAQQTLDRVRTGEANGYFNPDNLHASNH